MTDPLPGAVLETSDASWHEQGLHAFISSAPLIHDSYVSMVNDPTAGAVATFIGITRDNFEGKVVLKLEYEAYVPMAIKKLQVLCQELASKWEVTKVAIAHRIGVVAIGEASVIIAVSSPHRKEALEAVHWAIDELKSTIPIWKQEHYEGGAVWKENQDVRKLC